MLIIDALTTGMVEFFCLGLKNLLSHMLFDKLLGQYLSTERY